MKGLSLVLFLASFTFASAIDPCSCAPRSMTPHVKCCGVSNDASDPTTWSKCFACPCPADISGCGADYGTDAKTCVVNTFNCHCDKFAKDSSTGDPYGFYLPLMACSSDSATPELIVACCAATDVALGLAFNPVLPSPSPPPSLSFAESPAPPPPHSPPPSPPPKEPVVAYLRLEGELVLSGPFPTWTPPDSRRLEKAMSESLGIGEGNARVVGVKAGSVVIAFVVLQVDGVYVDRVDVRAKFDDPVRVAAIVKAVEKATSRTIVSLPVINKSTRIASGEAGASRTENLVYVRMPQYGYGLVGAFAILCGLGCVGGSAYGLRRRQLAQREPTAPISKL